MRPSKRRPDELRPLSFTRNYLGQAPGRVLVQAGQTAVLCACSVENTVPPFLVGSGKGWLTAEYGMLPGSTLGRKARDKGGKTDGRSVEIQRLIGRSLRAVVDLKQLGERTLWLDCEANKYIVYLRPLAGMPLGELHIARTSVSDLRPLRGMPLSVLSASDLRALSDLEPLHGMPLRSLSEPDQQLRVSLWRELY